MSLDIVALLAAFVLMVGAIIQGIVAVATRSVELSLVTLAMGGIAIVLVFYVWLKRRHSRKQ